MVKLLYGTGNPAKLDCMRQRLAPAGIEIIGLKDMEKAHRVCTRAATALLKTRG